MLSVLLRMQQSSQISVISLVQFISAKQKDVTFHRLDEAEPD